MVAPKYTKHSKELIIVVFRCFSNPGSLSKTKPTRQISPLAEKNKGCMHGLSAACAIASLQHFPGIMEHLGQESPKVCPRPMDCLPFRGHCRPQTWSCSTYRTRI